MRHLFIMRSAKATGEVRLDHNQINLSSLSRRPLAHGEGFPDGFWAAGAVNNTAISQTAVWLPVRLGNVGSNWDTTGERHARAW